MSDKFGELMKEKRASLGLTKAEMAEKLDCSVHVINHIEGSKFNPIGLETIKTLKKRFRGIAPEIEKTVAKRNKVAKAYYRELRARNANK